MADYFKNYTKPRNKFCTQHAKFPRVTARDAHGERRATKGTTEYLSTIPPRPYSHYTVKNRSNILQCARF